MSLVSAGWGFKDVLPIDWLVQLSIKQRMRSDWLEWADLQVSYALREAGLGEGDQSPSVYICNHLKLVTDTNETAKANEFNVFSFKPREHTLNRLQEVQLKARHVRYINSFEESFRRHLFGEVPRSVCLPELLHWWIFLSSVQTAKKFRRGEGRRVLKKGKKI